MNVVLFFQSTTRKSWRRKLSGVFRFAREHDWLIQVVDNTATPGEIMRDLRQWRPIGCLVDRACSIGEAPDATFGDIPVVYLDQNPAMPSDRHPCVLHDSAASARLGAKELVRLEYGNYGFIGLNGFFWSRERAAAFRAEVEACGSYSEFPAQGSIADWLKTLPKPCAILADNDYTAQRVHTAAKSINLRMPEDVALVGIDNDELICEALQPGLTSVLPDFQGAGYKLASMLAHELENRGGAPVIERYGPLELVRRGTTRLIRGSDVRVRRAIEFIRQNACIGPMGIDDVVKAMNCSRRLATMRFREATGRSIVDEIHEVRFDHACALLRETDHPIQMIVSECGYESDSFFKKFFREKTGMSMREWRSAERG